MQRNHAESGANHQTHRQLSFTIVGGVIASSIAMIGLVACGAGNSSPAESASTANNTALAHSSQAAKAAHAVEIPLGAAEWQESAIEYKVTMSPGQSILYKWTAVNLDGSPVTTAVEVDQHGHDVVDEGQEETVIQYQQARLTSDQGSITAPIDGIYGWYFKNHAADPILIRLEVEGFYALVAPGEPGNEFRISPVDPNAPDPDADLLE